MRGIRTGGVKRLVSTSGRFLAKKVKLLLANMLATMLLEFFCRRRGQLAYSEQRNDRILQLAMFDVGN